MIKLYQVAQYLLTRFEYLFLFIYNSKSKNAY
jgi:hypothetical protein